LRTIATVNHRDAVPCILDAIVSEQGPRLVGSGCFIRGGRFRPCHKRRLFRRGRRERIGRTCACDGGSLLNLLSLVVRPAISEAGAAVTATLFSNLLSLATTSADSSSASNRGAAIRFYPSSPASTTSCSATSWWPTERRVRSRLQAGLGGDRLEARRQPLFERKQSDNG
jgi:hypothetical protein